MPRGVSRPPARTDLTAEKVRSLLDYDPGTGVFRWKVQRGRCVKPGAVAGSIFWSGHSRYIRITIDDVRYMAHRLAWLHVSGEWPVSLIDHRDGNSLNNSIANLRPASNLENARNNSGRGYCKCRFRYVAYVYVLGKMVNLGTFATEDEAKEARRVGAEKYFGEFSSSHRGQSL